MHLRLKAGTTVTLLSATAVQLGRWPGRTTILTPTRSEVAHFLRLLDGTRSADSAAEASALGRPHAEITIRHLLDAGWLESPSRNGQALSHLHRTERLALAPAARAWALNSSTSRSSTDLLSHRRDQWVHVIGDGWLTFLAGHQLAAAGIGRITIDDPDLVGEDDVGVLGARVSDIGVKRSAVVRRQIRDAFPTVQVHAPGQSRPDAAVLVTDGEVLAAPHASRLLQQGVPHLPVVQRSGAFVIGPLVMPGTSACTRCADLHDTVHDPALSWLDLCARDAEQHAFYPVNRQPRTRDCATALIATSVAVLQIAAHLDARTGDTGMPVAAAGTRVIIEPGTGMQRTEHINAHPQCGCQWSTADSMDDPTDACRR